MTFARLLQEIFSQLVMLGEIVGNLAGTVGRHPLKPLAVSGDLLLLLQHPEPELVVNELLE